MNKQISNNINNVSASQLKKPSKLYKNWLDQICKSQIIKTNIKIKFFQANKKNYR